MQEGWKMFWLTEYKNILENPIRKNSNGWTIWAIFYHKVLMIIHRFKIHCTNTGVHQVRTWKLVWPATFYELLHKWRSLEALPQRLNSKSKRVCEWPFMEQVELDIPDTVCNFNSCSVSRASLISNASNTPTKTIYQLYVKRIQKLLQVLQI